MGVGQGGVSESVCTTHSHELTALSLSARGNMVATASTKVWIRISNHCMFMYIVH